MENTYNFEMGDTYLCKIEDEELRKNEILNIAEKFSIIIRGLNIDLQEKNEICAEFIQFVNNNGMVLLPIKRLQYLYKIIGIDSIIDSGLPALIRHYDILHKNLRIVV